MGKSINPKDSELAAGIINEGAKAAQPPVNQEAVKQQAQDIGNHANQGNAIPPQQGELQGQPGPATQLPGSDLPPVQAGTGASAQTLANELERQHNQNFTVPQYLNENPPLNQAEMDAISGFLQKFRKDQEAAKQALLPDPEADAKKEGANKLHTERVKKYGQGYIVAKRAQVETIFTRRAWDNLGGAQNKDGWKQVVEMPPEIAHLKKS